MQGAIAEISGWLEEMVKAAQAAASGATGGKDDVIGKVVKVDANAAAKGGDATSVNGIASGIKGIVDAAEKAGEAGKLESEAAAGGAGGDEQNADAGKLFAKKKNDNNDGGGDAADAEKAAAAVSAVSGKQILKAIVDAAKEQEEKKGVEDVKDATNPIEAAIGSTGEKAAAAFDKNEMKKNDQIAAAIVLRGMAKDGEFALKDAHDNAEKALKSTVEGAVSKTVVALTDVVRKAVQAGLKKVGDAVKSSSSGATIDKTP
ncbi:variable large family protein [Borreliella kurtenbachii]|uniref:variable large family protein n=1 Tax=Borreliella kurtenbachii TaxID=1196056 RepID=UPI003AB6E982